MNSPRVTYSDAPGMVRKAYYTGRQVGTAYIAQNLLRTISDTRPIADYDLAVGDIVQFDPYTPQPNITSQPAAANASTQAGQDACLGLGPAVGAPNIGAAFRAASAAAAVTAIGANGVPTPADIGANTTVFQPRLYVVTGVNQTINTRSDPLNSNANLARQRDGGWIEVCPIGTVDALFYKNTDVAVPAGTPLGLFMPATSAASGGIILFGSSTANVGKPAFTNLLDADLDRTLTTAATTVRNVLDILSRIQAVLAEENLASASGGSGDAVTSLRKVSLGMGFGQFGF